MKTGHARGLWIALSFSSLLVCRNGSRPSVNHWWYFGLKARSVGRQGPRKACQGIANGDRDAVVRID
jgi:hypothetical protein